MSRNPQNVIIDRDPGDEHLNNTLITHTDNRDPGDECDAAKKRAESRVAFFIKPKTPVITGRDPGDEHTAASTQKNNEDGHGDVHQPTPFRSKL